jgi:hypothetical protein
MPSLSRIDEHRSSKSLIRLLALFLALGVAAPPLLAQEWDHINGRDKVHDPTGAWLINSPAGLFLIALHKGGTLTGDHQGESAFDPAATNPPMPDANVIMSPQSGVWQTTGLNTFAAESLVIEYQVEDEHGGSPHIPLEGNCQTPLKVGLPMLP